MLLRTQQRHTEKQVVVQPPAPAQPGIVLAASRQAGKGLAAGTQQLMVFQKLTKFDDLLDVRAQGCFCVNRPADVFRAVLPAQQALELQPANAVEAVDDGVLDYPGRFAVAVRRALQQAQVFAQRWWRQLGRVGDHKPLHARSAAKGRRSR
ncbi:hypothetical protein D3C80_1159600 [compost metagenome]